MQFSTYQPVDLIFKLIVPENISLPRRAFGAVKKWKALPYYNIIITQLVANWRIVLDTWIFVKTFKVSLLARHSLVLASSKHI